MLEIPESNVIANQICNTVKGKTISIAEANRSPHKFAWYNGNYEEYGNMGGYIYYCEKCQPLIK